jgi:exodeoxyribonuclease V gamma subunit
MPAKKKATELPPELCGLRVYASNRLEVLAGQLASTMRTDPLGPLEREVIVVQSRGMYRWLTLELAKQLGIAATIATPFPGTFCRALAERIEGRLLAGPAERYEIATPSAFDREILAWRIFRLLGHGTSEVRGPAATYTKDDPDQRKRFQLATRLAERFDEYQLYRSDLLLAWERGEQPIGDASRRDTATWQAAIWRELVAEAGATDVDLANRFVALTRELGRADHAPRGLPPRISVFGAASLPPIFLDLLVAVARFAPVSIYVVSPTREYWSDIRPPREAAKQLDLLRDKALDVAYAHVETGNPLLASLGRQGRELAGLLHERDTDGSAWHDLEYRVPQRRTVLGALQADIVELVDRNEGANGARRLPVPAGDRSLAIHVCHSPMREMQVLRDVILDAFASDASLRPGDVFVLAPDIGKYAPYIEAVFGVEHAGEPLLPFAIADRPARSEHPIVDAAFRILEAVGGRATASGILSLLDAEPVRRSAAIAAEQITTVREWVRVANIRWGRDGAQRRDSFDLPCDDFDTWRAGLDRLLLGYAVGDAQTLVCGILPRGAAAAQADLLGRFAAFADRLFGRLRDLASPRTLDRWAADIQSALTDLLVAGDEASERAFEQLRTTIDRLARACDFARVDEAVSLEVVRETLRAQMDVQGGGAGFITGAITFCSLKPMRAIPAKIVCIAGLNNAEFPRRDRPASFDLVAADRRPGDRSPRDDDRYSFLEAVCSAGDRLVLSYIGRSQKDNSELAPSSVLSELMGVLDATFLPGGNRSAHETFTTEHALQPFSARYFAATPEAAARSYSKENKRAAAALAAASDTPQPFLSGPLAATDESTEVSVAELAEFWSDPGKYFCRRVLRLRALGDDGEPVDVEAFGADPLADYGVLDRLVARRLADVPGGEDELEVLRAAVGLPHAGVGRAHYAELDREAREFVETVRKVAGGTPVFLEPLVVELAGTGWRLVGRIEQLTERGLLHFRPAKIKSKDYLRAWIPHVVMNAFASAPARQTTIVAKDKVVAFAAPKDANAILDKLVRGFVAGRALPPPLLERASFAYAHTLGTSKKDAAEARVSALKEARKKLEGDGFGRARGDAEDEHFRLVFRDRDPLGEEREVFEDAARTLWDPVFAAATELTLGEDQP